jgi:hypothetical protein
MTIAMFNKNDKIYMIKTVGNAANKFRHTAISVATYIVSLLKVSEHGL